MNAPCARRLENRRLRAARDPGDTLLTLATGYDLGPFGRRAWAAR